MTGYFDENIYAQSERSSVDERSRLAYLKAHRLLRLSRLAGVYMVPPTDYPFVERILSSPNTGENIRKMVADWASQGRAMRQKDGIAAAEVLCAVTPYRLWMGPK